MLALAILRTLDAPLHRSRAAETAGAPAEDTRDPRDRAQEALLARVARDVLAHLAEGTDLDECLDAAVRSSEFVEAARGPFMLAREGFAFVRHARLELGRRHDARTAEETGQGLDALQEMFELQEPLEKAPAYFIALALLGGRSLVDLVYDVRWPSFVTDALADQLEATVALGVLLHASLATAALSRDSELALATRFQHGMRSALRVAQLPVADWERAFLAQADAVTRLQSSAGSNAGHAA